MGVGLVVALLLGPGSGAGRYDGIAPPENMEAAAAQIPGARVEMFEGGHMLLAQDHTAFPKIVDFLRDN